MPPNPFIALFERPVVTITALAYAVFLLVVIYGLAVTTWKNAITLYLRWANQRHQWESVYNPPTMWLARIAGNALLLVVALLAIAALIHVLTQGLPW